MKITKSLLLTLPLTLGLMQTVSAQMVVANDYFVVNFLDTASWGDYSSDAQLQNILKGVQGSIDYWGSLLGENHRPLTGDYPNDPFTGAPVASWERRVVIDFSFDTMNPALASTAVPTMIYSDDNFDNPLLTVPNGTSYNKVSRAELKLKTNGNFPLSLYSDETTDMTITFGSGGFGGGFSFDGVPGSGYDFQTIFLHEMTHGMGFESDAYGVDGYSGNENKTALDASMGTSIGATPGSELAVWDKNEKGQLVQVATLRNPSGEFAQGEDIVHIDYDLGEEAPLMRHTISEFDPVQREFTMADIAVLEAMGWTLTVSATPDPPKDITVTGDSPFRAEFPTMEGGTGNSVYSLTGIVIADGKINDSLTLQLRLSSEQLNLFKLSYEAGNVIGFALDGISLEEYNASGIEYQDITLRIDGLDYQVLGVSEYTPFGSTQSEVILYIPEPSTATLSLLALTGLLARRRRAA